MTFFTDELFTEVIESSKAMLKTLVDDLGVDSVFGLERPITFAVATRFNRPAEDGRRFDFVPLNDRGLPFEIHFELYKSFLKQETNKVNESTGEQIVAAMVISVATVRLKDSDTDSTEENLVQLIETPDGRMHMLVCGREGDKLGVRKEVRDDAYAYDDPGRFQNVYDLAPPGVRTEPEVN